ncbi:PD-(D/E)XK nuclease family transposase, partial [uncultured Lamprocystis sp.]|uniref:PD-(D/E)XK nuclease family transposase n=1 Tax=uncultured Lamprocystis sp. TaxID=543132 RepID=UPI0025F94AAF
MCDLLDPKNDYVFKRLFADAPDLLVALINAVRRCAAPITHIAVKNPAIDAAELHGKYIILDLRAEDAAGRQCNIEMQVRRYRAWSAVGWGEERTPTSPAANRWGSFVTPTYG